MKTNQKNVRLRENWIDCLKGVAIIAVIIDHLYGILYIQKDVQYATFFSVTTFVFAGGVNSFFSCKKHINEKYIYDICRRLLNIMVPYAMAVGLYQFQEDKFLDLGRYFKSIISFSGINLFYYLIFYIQLIVISRFIYYIIEIIARSKYPAMGYMGLLSGSVVVALFSIHYTRVPLREGQALFGGTYLTVFVCGMIFAKTRGNTKAIREKWIPICVITVMFCYWFMVHNNFEIDRLLGLGINPPGITIGLYSAIVIAMIILLSAWIEERGICKLLYSIICMCGRYSYYIYLFHMLFILVLLHKVLEVYELNIWLNRIIAITIPMGGSIILGMIVEKLILFMKGKYNVER